jgi:hypothetical protein
VEPAQPKIIRRLAEVLEADPAEFLKRLERG